MSSSDTTFASFEEALKKAVEDGVVAGANAFARNKSGRYMILTFQQGFMSSTNTPEGTLNYSTAVGKRSLAEGSDEPFELDTVLAIASCTKLATSVSAMQIVERGLVGLDDDLTDIIPLLGKQEILSINGDGVATTKKRQNRLTLR